MLIRQRIYNGLIGVFLAGMVVGLVGCMEQTALWTAARYGQAEKVKLLLANNADVNAAKTNGATPLYTASVYGHTEVVKLLLANNADVNIANTRGSGMAHDPLPLGVATPFGALPFGATPLFQASKYGRIEIVKLLLARGADVNAAKTNGNTPLWIASAIHHIEIVKLLLDNNADVNIASEHPLTPLNLAFYHKDLIELLKAYGAK